MKIAVVGSGGREHAIIKKIKENPEVETIYALPGNGGIAADATCVPVGAKDIEGIVRFCKENSIDYVVVAPDDPLVMGAVDALEAAGARVILTREEDKAFADKKRPDLDARLQMARDAGADMLLSVHMNQYHSARESGPQVFYRQAHQESRLLAGCIQQSMIADLQPKKARAALAGDYYMLSLNIPSVLVECGFISNPEEEKMLLDEAYQKRLAEAVCKGVCEYAALRGEGA